MMPPTSIDGTDITGATIDGQDVQEITIDGQTVFTAETLPVAYSDLIAWYPFDSSFYGGSDADDGTALFNSAQSGDSTAYDGTVNGASYESSGGVTDINAGATSGAFDFDGSDDDIELLGTGLENVILNLNSITIMAWANVDNSNDTQPVFSWDFRRFSFGYKIDNMSGWGLRCDGPSQPTQLIDSNDTTTNSYVHLCATFDGSQAEFYLNAVSQGTTRFDGFVDDQTFRIGKSNKGFFNGTIDDVRFYDTDLSTSQIETIVQNTQDPNSPVFP